MDHSNLLPEARGDIGRMCISLSVISKQCFLAQQNLLYLI